MKKIFALGLVALLLAVIQFVAPRIAPVDQDVGICYVLPMDQVRQDMSYIADASIIPAPDLRVSSMGYVEKYSNNDFMYSSSMTAPVPVESILIQRTTANSKLQPEGIKPYLGLEEGLVRSHASDCPRAGEMARHI